LPGRSGQIARINTDGSVAVEIEGRSIDVDSFASARILVTA